MEPACRSGLWPEFMIFAGAGLRVGIMISNRIRSWIKSEIFGFYWSRITAFTELKFALTGYSLAWCHRLFSWLYCTVNYSMQLAAGDEGGWQTGGLCSRLAHGQCSTAASQEEFYFLDTSVTGRFTSALYLKRYSQLVIFSEMHKTTVYVKCNNSSAVST